MRTALIGLIAIALGACASGGEVKMPDVPKVVTQTVKEYRPLPPQLLRPEEKPEPANGSLGALDRSHAKRGDVIDVLNCRILALQAVDGGLDVPGHACDKILKDLRQ